MALHSKYNLKHRVYNLLDSKSKNTISKIVQGAIVIMIILNVASLILESVNSFKFKYLNFLLWFKLLSIMFFSLEYIVRMWTITCNPKYSHPIKGRIRYAFTSMQLIDLLAILPFYLTFVHVDLRILKLLRVFKLLRIFRVTSYIPALAIIVNVLRRKSAELLISAVLLFFLLLIASTAIFYAENPAQPASFASIPDSMWWSVITMCTVGYGDVYPITPIGKVIGGFVSVIGVSFFALPTGILTSGFNEAMQERKNKEANKSKKIESTCPTCGKTVED